MSAQTVTLIALALLAVAGATVAVTGWMHVSRMQDEGSETPDSDPASDTDEGADADADESAEEGAEEGDGGASVPAEDAAAEES